MEGFNEQILKKKKGIKEMAIILGCILAFMILLVVGFFASLMLKGFGFIIILAIMGGGYGLVRLITSQNIEFEYSVFQGGIDIDQIIAQRKRKRIVSVSGKRIESLEPYKKEQFINKKFDRTVVAAPSDMEENLWSFTYRSKKNGHTLVIFQPNEKVLEGLSKGLSSLVLRETKKNM